MTGNTGVCSKRFEEKDIKVSSTDKRRQSRKTSQLCKLVFKPFAIPYIFPGLPSQYNVETSLSRYTSASSSSRVEKENEKIKQQYSEFCAEDAIESLHNLKERLKKIVTFRGLLQCDYSNSIIFHCFEHYEISFISKVVCFSNCIR